MRGEGFGADYYPPAAFGKTYYSDVRSVMMEGRVDLSGG